MANRTRNIVLRVPVTSEERALIQQKMAQLHTKNFSAYARKILIDGYIVHMDTSDIRAQTAELQKIGVNVNQIARRINSNVLAMDCLCFSLYWFNTAASCSISLSTREMSSIFSDFPVVRSVICFDRLRICLLICTYLKSTTIKTAITKINNNFIPDTSLLVI